MTFAAANSIAAKLLSERLLIYKRNIIMRYTSVCMRKWILWDFKADSASSNVLQTGKTLFFDFEGEKPLGWSR